MLARTRRVPTLAAALALGLTTAAGVAGTAAAGTAPTAGAPTAPNHALAAPQTSTLPNGDRVVVTGTGPAASVMVQAPDGRTVPAVRFAPDPHHAYVIPASVLAHPAQLTTAQHQIAALSAPGAPAATRWTGATAGGAAGRSAGPPRRCPGGIPQQKQSLSAWLRRLAGPGVFPYNTAPAPPASARRQGNVFP